jgi:asparagine synthase (glutamine-hydrolysing)
VDDCVLFSACDSLPEDLQALGCDEPPTIGYRLGILEEAKSLYPGDLARQAMYLDQHTFLCSLLDRNDRMTMGASIECRVPMLDYRLVEMAAALPSHVMRPGSKRLLRTAMRGRLPDEVLRSRKWGFGVPWAQYFRELPRLRDELRNLPASEPVASGPFRKDSLTQAIEGFLRGDDRHSDLLMQLAFISIWHRSVDRATAGVA